MRGNDDSISDGDAADGTTDLCNNPDRLVADNFDGSSNSLRDFAFIR
jgi:hypothetical protein